MEKMKFRGHETFFIRKGWLNKGMRYIQRILMYLWEPMEIQVIF